ncbi:MAG: GNAT family N-acetyltransferase [Candidatus Eisenbacteria bacterium]
MSSRDVPSHKTGENARQLKLGVRRARASDREPLLAMSEGIWGGSDYLPLVWDRWLADSEGVLLTATLDGAPVGLSKVSVLAPGEVWLEGLRLHPDLHGKGLVKQINRVSFREALKLNPRTIRYSTGAGNAASRHLGEIRGFWMVARTQWMWGTALKTGEQAGRVALESELDDVLRYVEASDCYAATGGLYAKGWKFPALDRRALRSLLRKGRVLVAGSRRALRGVAVYDIGNIDGEVCLGFLDGDDDARSELARDVLRVAGSLGQKDSSAMLPKGAIADAAAEAGYGLVIAAEAVVYELGARGLGDGDETLDSLLWRTLLSNSDDAADRLAELLTERAPLDLSRENVRDFVTRHLIPDAARETYALIENVQYRLEGWSLRGVLRGIAMHFMDRYGVAGDSVRTTKNTVSFWLGDKRLAVVRLARRSLTLSLGPGFGPIFDGKAKLDVDAVRLPESSFDEKAGRYGAITLKLSKERQVREATRAIDVMMKSALGPARRRTSRRGR